MLFNLNLCVAGVYILFTITSYAQGQAKSSAEIACT
jgi:hypothetical protein